MGSATNCANSCNGMRVCVTEVINGYKRFGFPNGGGGKIEGRHILIIAIIMSEHRVDHMNRKGGHSVIMQGGPFHRCVHQIAWTRAKRQGSGKP